VECTLFGLDDEGIPKQALKNGLDMVDKDIVQINKKKSAPTDNNEGRMMPAAKDLMYVSTTSLSGADREKRRTLGGDVPGCRLIAQSYRRWG